MKPETFLPKAVKILEKLDLSMDYEDLITSIFDKVKNMGVMVVTYNPGKELIRARPMEDGEKRFTMIKDFSFKPQHLNYRYQRASTPNRTMFYASTIRDNPRPGEIDIARVIGLAESIPWIRDKSNSGLMIIAYGNWVTHEPLELIAIVNNKGFHEVNSFAKEIYEKLIHNLL